MTTPPNGWQTLIVILPSILAFLTAALGAVLVFLGNRQTREYHGHVNSRLTELIAANRRADLAEGHAAGRAAEQASKEPPSQGEGI